MSDRKFGEVLRKLRVAKGMSQFQLGTLIGVSDKAISKWENGYCKPKSTMLLKLSNVLGVSVELLVTEMTPDEQKLQN